MSTEQPQKTEQLDRSVAAQFSRDLFLIFSMMAKYCVTDKEARCKWRRLKVEVYRVCQQAAEVAECFPPPPQNGGPTDTHP